MLSLAAHYAQHTVLLCFTPSGTARHRLSRAFSHHCNGSGRPPHAQHVCVKILNGLKIHSLGFGKGCKVQKDGVLPQIADDLNHGPQHPLSVTAAAQLSRRRRPTPEATRLCDWHETLSQLSPEARMDTLHRSARAIISTLDVHSCPDTHGYMNAQRARATPRDPGPVLSQQHAQRTCMHKPRDQLETSARREARPALQIRFATHPPHGPRH